MDHGSCAEYALLFKTMSSDLEMLMEEDESREQDSIDLTAEDCGDQTSAVVVSFEQY